MTRDSGDAAGVSVVIVNGHREESEFLARPLREAGMQVECASEPGALLERVGPRGAPDLIVLDVHVPEIDGWRLCRLLRSPAFAEANDCPVLVTSGIYTGSDAQEVSRGLGANGFLPLPCAPEEVVAAAQAALRGDAPDPRPRVLVIDDEPAVRQYLRHGLLKHGFTVSETGAVAEARAAFDACRPAVVLLDHHLSGGNGLELVPHFKTPCSPVVVIAMTGDLSPELAVEYSRLGVDRFVRKPFKIGYLVSVVTGAQRERALLRVEEILSARTRVQREQDARMMQRARLASLGELAAGLAHEINNPVFGITSAVELLGRDMPAGSVQRQLTDMIRNESERIALMVKRLLAFARTDLDGMTPSHLHELVTNTLTLIGSRLRRSSIRLQVDVPSNLPPLCCHGSQIQQVIMNLVANAADALNARYPRYEQDKILSIRAAEADRGDRPGLRLEVEDRGEGIPEERMPRLFESFYTTKQTGTGLGLSIAAEIVNRHGGRIDVESVVNRYTRFSLWLPRDGSADEPRNEQDTKP